MKLNLKRKRKKNINKIKHLEILLVRIKYANNPNKLENASREINKKEFIDEILHEIKREILSDYEGELEMVGRIKVGDQIRQTHIRFRIIDDFESYINSIDEGYDAEDNIFNGNIYELNTPHFNKVNRSQ